METVKANGMGVRVLDFLRRFLERRYLPVVLAVGAVLVMLPALKSGLIADDLPQRAVELRPDQLPSRMQETGNPADSGSFPTVIRKLYFYRSPQEMRLMKGYGMLPWWTPDDLRLGLWRPLTAITFWIDYRLFPDSPALMHAENIACFAAIVFLLALVYRNLMGTGWAAGLAALLFLLDNNTYFPVMFIANRAFILSLPFGLLCLYQHHRWRSAKSCSGGVLAALFLALSLFSNEGGASTFAFILAYALVLEPGSFRNRALTVLPSILIMVLWRTIYTLSGFGLFHVTGYIDPAIEPLSFAQAVVPRAAVLLGGQLAGVAPDVMFALSPELKPIGVALYCACAVAVLLVLLPWVRRDKMAAFWLVAMLLAAIPAATVVPTGKNLGFVAVGAYGLIASFVAGLVARPGRLPESCLYRVPAWAACALLLLMHVPGAIAGRILVINTLAHAPERMDELIDVGNSPDAENKHVIVVNAPCAATLTFGPSYKAYHHQPLPRSMRTLVPGCTSFDVQRTDDQTLVIQSRAPNIFSCDNMGPIHGAYAIANFNRLLCGPRCKKGDRFDLGRLTVEILETDASNLPSRVAFRFDSSLDSPDFQWLRFDWRTGLNHPFQVPAIGQSVTLAGPSRESDLERKKFSRK